MFLSFVCFAVFFSAADLVELTFYRLLLTVSLCTIELLAAFSFDFCLNEGPCNNSMSSSHNAQHVSEHCITPQITEFILTLECTSPVFSNPELN